MQRQRRVMFVRQHGGGFRPFAGFGDAATDNDADVIAAIAAVTRAGTMPEMFPVNSDNWNVLVNQQNLLAALMRGELSLESKRKELNERTLYLRAINPPVYVMPPIDSHPAPPAGYHYDNNWQLVPDALDPNPQPIPIVTTLPPITGSGILDGTITLPVIGAISKKTALLLGAAAAFFLMKE